jgi:hypothetical protein
MIKVICYSDHPEIFILGNCTSLFNWTKPIKMVKKQDYFEIDFPVDIPNLEFKFKTVISWEWCNNRHYYFNPQDTQKILICNYNEQEFQIKNITPKEKPNNFIMDVPKCVEFDNPQVLTILNHSYYYIRTFNAKNYYCVFVQLVKPFIQELNNYYNHKKRVCYICGAFAEYNYKKYGYGLYCDVHKLDGMGFVGNYFCWHSDCLKEGDFRAPNSVEVYCGGHRTLNMKLFQKY